MRVLLIDDEPAMLTALSQLLARIEDVVVAGTANSRAEAIELAACSDPAFDLAFIDIMIADDNGLALAAELREMNAELDIVFVTSHKEYALDAYGAYPLDYIVKPVTRKRLEETVARAARRRVRPPQATANGTTGAAQPLTVAGLGSFYASTAQGETLHWISRKSQELFAYLLLCRGNRASKARILEELFQEREGKSSELYLNTALYQLRKTLAKHGYDAKELLFSDREHYRMSLAPIAVDFIRFEERSTALHVIDADNVEEAIETEAMYAGELFEDKPYAWALAERERLSDLYEALARRLADWLLAHRRTHEAVQIAKKLVRRNELDEAANRLLLQGYAALEDRIALQTHYKQYAELLQRELHIQPSEDLAEWYRRQ